MPEMKTLTVNGVTYDIRDSSAVPATRTVNGKPLDTDISLTASDVGARADSWMPTASDVGAAPAGFGLGGSKSISVDELDSTTAPGFYYIAGTMTVNNVTANYWYMYVSAYGSGSLHCTQELRPVGSAKITLQRFRNSGTWHGWECENPPMTVGVEYRTTERYAGKPVFTQLIDCGLSADKKTISYLNSEQIMAVIRHAGRISGSVAPQANNNDWTNAWSLQFLVSTTSAGLRCGTSLVGKQTYLQIWYVKGAEFE